MPHGNITLAWREPFTNREIHVLHAAAFGTRLFVETEWDWVALVHAARDGARGAGAQAAVRA